MANSSEQWMGYVMIIFVCISTAGLTETTEIAESHFNYPFIMRYICMTAGIFSSVPLLICKWYNPSPSTQILKNDYKMYFYVWSFIGAMSLTSGGMIYFLSFDGVSVPTATALGGTRAVMVLILSVILLNEEVTIWKIFAVIVSILGILCYVYEAKLNDSDSDTNNESGNGVEDTLWGCLLCLVANFMFAFCDVIAGKVSESYNNKMMGGLYYTVFQGIYQLPIFLWVFWFPKQIKTTNEWNNIWWCLLPAVALTMNNASVYIGVTIKSPFYVNIGTLLGIPLAFVVDIFVHKYIPTYLPILGAILLIISFLMLEVIQPPKRIKFLNLVLINGDSHEKDDDDFHKKHSNKNIDGDDDEKEELVQPLIDNDMGLTASLQSDILSS